MKKIRSIVKTVWPSLMLGMALSINFSNPRVVSADSIDSIDPDADQILQSMSSYLTETKAFSVDADIDTEIITKDGQKLQFSSDATLILQRPDQFHIQRKGMIANTEFVFDGETLTLHGKKSNVYSQLDVEGSIDDAILAFELETGIPAPGADLLFTEPYTMLSSEVESSTYLGTTYINGIECHHLAFRGDRVDWQLWIQSGEQPLPMKYVITSKWQASAPQYQIRFRNWNTNPQINEGQFNFSAPESATELEALPASELEEFTSTEEE